MSLVYAVVFGYFSLATSVGTYSNNVCFSYLGPAVFFASSLPVSVDHIVNVVLLGASYKVFGVNTGGVVALVAHYVRAF